MKEIYNISMWDGEDRVFSSSGKGVYDNVDLFISTLTPEAFGFHMRANYAFVVKYIERGPAVSQKAFKQKSINTAPVLIINVE